MKKHCKLVFLQPGPSPSNHSGMWPPLRLLLCVRNQRENGWPCISTSPMANRMMRPIWLYVISFTSLLSHFSLCNGYKLWPQTLETLSREAISKSNCYNCLCALQVEKKNKKPKPLKYLVMALKCRRMRIRPQGKQRAALRIAFGV